VTAGGRLGRAGLTATAVSIGCTIAVAAAGPSLLEPPLPGAAGQPPWTFDLRLDPYPAVGLAAASLAAGTLGLALTLRAMRLGWTVRPRYVLLAGVIAAIVVGTTGPFGTSDFLSYAAYGRELVTGHNPYLMAPQALARLGDPVARAVQDWAGTPSVYGALASGVFGLASLIGGASARLTVFVLDLLNAAAFVGAGLLLDRLARERPSTRRGVPEGRPPASVSSPTRAVPSGRPPGSAEPRLRAAVLWTCNPLLIQVLVAGSHVDGLAAACSIGGIAALAPLIQNDSTGSKPVPRALAAGVILGLGFAVKPTVLLVFAGLAIAVAARRPAPEPASRWTLGGLAAGFCAAAAADVALIGRAGVAQSLRASGMVSVGSPWRVVRTVLRVTLMSESGADDVVRVLAVVLMVALAAALLRFGGAGVVHVASGASGGASGASGGASGASGASGGASGASLGSPQRPRLRNRRCWNDLDCAINVVGGALVWAPFALVLAWLVAWPYVLPWYDALGWALLPLLPATGLDWLLLARTAALAFGYLPARSAGITIPAGLRWMEPVIRSGVTPVVLAVVTLLLVIGLRRRARSWRSVRSPQPAGLAEANHT
jgi:hypothetical protein